MPRADLLVFNASEVATLRGARGPRRGRRLGALGLVQDGAVAVRDGRILEVGRSATLRSRYRGAVRMDAEGGVVTPGFVDAHTHLPFAGSRAFELSMKLQGRSYLDILRAGGGIHRTVRDTRRATPAALHRLMLERLRVMLAWGTTTAEAKSGYGLTVGDEVKQLRAVRAADAAQPVDLVPTFLGAHVVPREYARDRGAYVDLVVDRMLPRVAREGLAAFCDVFLEESAFTRDECERILGAAAALGLSTKLHADEFTNQRGAELAARLRCASAEHLLRVGARGVRALAGSDTVAVLLPGVNVTGFLDRYAPARRLVDAGAAVALGTDFNPNCPVLTMPAVIQWACYHLRLTPAEALAAATINAAHAVGRGDRVGSLAPGKQADLLVLDAETHVDLVYRVGPNPVRHVLKNGRLVPSRRRQNP